MTFLRLAWQLLLTLSTAFIATRAFSVTLRLGRRAFFVSEIKLQSSGSLHDEPLAFHASTEAEELRNDYLDRIRIPRDDASAMARRGPNVDDLRQLLSAHLRTVPFENMDQHSHPAHSETEAVPKRRNESLPSLDVRKSLRKIVQQKRGGFCFELNFSFAWLLRSLGYTVRLALADVGCNETIPSHVVLLVDDLVNNIPLLVDVGFGNPEIYELPIVYNEPTQVRGDFYRFAPNDTDRFNTALYRTRIEAPNVEEPMYRFHSYDNLSFDAHEFEKGLDAVLTTSEFFTTKRICVLGTERGHVTLGRDYIKWIERGETVRREELPTETEWRLKLSQQFGVVLRPEDSDVGYYYI